ncbi:hypothetical protein FRC11_003977 [Ceratobasidium sp. 423]|nr:hypothetical protein FRC11_003977 [Ceratobasidium sp. 423]
MGSESEGGILQRSSSVRPHSSKGSTATNFVAPIADIPETADDMSIASLVPPPHAPSLRRTVSMADLELEADIDRAFGRTAASVESES